MGSIIRNTIIRVTAVGVGVAEWMALRAVTVAISGGENCFYLAGKGSGKYWRWFGDGSMALMICDDLSIWKGPIAWIHA